MHIRDFSGRKIHFIGIGGISMSGLAEVLLRLGYSVSGSDQTDNPLLHKLRSLGADIYIGHRAGQQKGAALVIKNAAIGDDNPELSAARAEGVPVMERTDLLGQLMGEYRHTVSVCGSHGKTTATSMLTTILVLTGRDPTANIGSVLPLIGGATRAGGREFFVVEASEYKDDFLRLPSTHIVMLNIDADHLDYFRDIDHIAESFAAFAALLPDDGMLIGNGDDPRVRAIMERCGRAVRSFGLSEGNDWRAADIRVSGEGHARFTLLLEERPVTGVRLAVPGRHHVMNALAAIAAAHACGVPAAEAARALAAYTGAGRRFEPAGCWRGAALYHDYAHHPVEVAATLETARAMRPRRLWCVFQPHTYSRTRALFDDFTRCFDAADELILLPIYAAREPDPGDISSAMLAEAINRRPGHKPCRHADSFQAAADLIRREAAPGDLVLTVGAGDIEELTALIRE